MELDAFLDAVITTPEGWFCLAIGKSGGVSWFERFYRWPAQRNDILEAIAKHRGEHNIYFTAYLFDVASSKKSGVLPSRTIQADLDDADIADLPLTPSVLVRTSPGRHQGYWFLREALPADQHQMLSRRLTYSIPKCDVSGWSLGHKVRVPDTWNFKYLDGPKPIEVVDGALKQYDISDLEMLPEVPGHADAVDVDGFLGETGNINAEWVGSGPLELLESLRGKIDAKTYVQYGQATSDRSTALWRLMCQAFAKGGLDRERVFFLAKHSANNKFADLRHNGDRELAKDVLRAEATVRSSSSNPREVIEQLRKSGPSAVRKPIILRQVVDFMKERGQFLHTLNDMTWYVRRDNGRPISISERSDYLNMILDIEYGLNVTETDHNYTVAGLCAYTRNLTPTGIQASLSHYDPDTRTMLLHTGRRDVLKITPTSIDRIVDGSHGVVFPWQVGSEPFSMGTPDYNWAEHLFGRSAGNDALANLINLRRNDVLALLRVWLLFILFRNIAVSRPILACFGQPGSGKSTLFRKVYALLYGRYKGISSVTTPEDFDHSVAGDPFVVLDGVDSPASWLPDRLSLSASISDITKRKLWTDSDTVIIKRQALVGISAHNPRFGREDIADRLLLLAFERLPHFLPEQPIIDYVLTNRSALWAGIVADIQAVIATDVPPVDVQFRIEDFARLGVWMSRALGCEAEFTRSINEVRYGQRSFSLEEDAILISALNKVCESHEIKDWPPSKLWAQLEFASADKVSFVRLYRSSTWLGKKLLSLQDSMTIAFNVEYRHDTTLNAKLWTISKKGGTRNGSGTAGSANSDSLRTITV